MLRARNKKSVLTCMGSKLIEEGKIKTSSCLKREGEGKKVHAGKAQSQLFLYRSRGRVRGKTSELALGRWRGGKKSQLRRGSDRSKKSSRQEEQKG